jgi:hypothetical protein
MSLLVALASAVSAPIPVKLTACASPVCLTKPAVDLDCAITERGKPWRQLRIVRSGGRAYEVPRSDGGRTFERTPLTWSFADTSGEFASYKQTELNSVEVWFRNGIGTSLIFTDRYSRLQDFSSIRIDIHNQSNDGREARTIVGLCEVREIAQAPLSDNERQQVLKQ